MSRAWGGPRTSGYSSVDKVLTSVSFHFLISRKCLNMGFYRCLPGRTAGRNKGVSSAWQQPSVDRRLKEPAGICWKGCFILISASLWDTVHCTREAPE